MDSSMMAMDHHQIILNTTTTTTHEPAANDDHDEDILNNYVAEASFFCTDNNPPDSYAVVCETKVAEWLNRNTFMERKASVKLATCSNKNLGLDHPCPRRAAAVSLNQRAKLSIIGFRKKHHDHHQSVNHVKSKENVRLFRNRSEPGRDYCLLITEPVSPKVSCVGRVGSVRVQGRKAKAGVWTSFKAAFSNLLNSDQLAAA